MEGRYSVGEIMSENVIVSISVESIYDCARKMASKRVGSLVIVDGYSVVGIITEQDISRKVIARDLAARETPVSVIMSSNVISIEPGKDLQEAIELMASNEIKHLPVIKNGELLGVVTSKDIVAIEPVLIEMLKFRNSSERVKGLAKTL